MKLIEIRIKNHYSGGSRISQTGAPSSKVGGANLLFSPIFPEHYKNEINWTEKGACPCPPPRPRIHQCTTEL